MIETILKIDGMMCGMCESHINDVIRSKFSVKKVTASHSRGEAVILSETQIPEAELKAALDPTGYRLLRCSCEPYEKKGGLFSFLKK